MNILYFSSLLAVKESDISRHCVQVMHIWYFAKNSSHSMMKLFLLLLAPSDEYLTMLKPILYQLISMLLCLLVPNWEYLNQTNVYSVLNSKWEFKMLNDCSESSGWWCCHFLESWQAADFHGACLQFHVYSLFSLSLFAHDDKQGGLGMNTPCMTNTFLDNFSLISWSVIESS